ncbi:MAG: hypothetical protein ACQEQ8_09170 [Pseudomonadota bacterium]
MSSTIKYATATAMVAGLSLSAYLLMSPASPVTSASNSTQQCEQLLSSSENQRAISQCEAPANAVTWTNWVKGESRSAQFHFFDLFELLFGSADKKQKANDQFSQQSSL